MDAARDDPRWSSALAWRTGGDDNGLLGTPEPLDLLIKLSDARSLCYCCAGGCRPNASYADLADQFELFRRRAKRRVKPSDESAN